MAGVGKKRKVTGWLFLGAFFILLALKVGFLPSFEERRNPTTSFSSDKVEKWMEITHEGKPVGINYRLLTPHEGGYKLEEEITLHVKTMGIPQVVRCFIAGELDSRFKLREFWSVVSSSLYQMKISGTVREGKLFLRIGEKSMVINLPQEPHFPGDLCRVAEGEGLSIPLFDPLMGGMKEVRVKHLGYEFKAKGERTERLAKLEIRYGEFTEHAWCNDKGEMVREEGPWGLAMEKVEKERGERLKREIGEGLEITEKTAIKVNTWIKEPERLSLLICKIGGIDTGRFFLHGGRQTLAGQTLTIRKESIFHSPSQVKEASPAWALVETPFIQVGHQKIKEALQQIIKDNDSQRVKVEKIIRWVYRELDKWPVSSLTDSVSILTNKRGDCTEHAILVSALGRTAGIPTAIETGVVYRGGRFYYHAWNAFYLKDYGGWITADSVFNQLPADVTHIRFLRGHMEHELSPFLELLGKLRISIERMECDNS